MPYDSVVAPVWRPVAVWRAHATIAPNSEKIRRKPYILSFCYEGLHLLHRMSLIVLNPSFPVRFKEVPGYDNACHRSFHSIPY
jgi:hypothetical protein